MMALGSEGVAPAGPGTRVRAWDGVPVDGLAARLGVPGVEAYASIDSTNDRAAELAAAGAPALTVVLADAQTAGRGRRGARWWSEPGRGLLMSIVGPPTDRSAAPGCLPLLVGLAVAEGVEACCPGLPVSVKWPNDLLVHDRKLAGVLCEAHGGAIVIGVGLNVRGRPAASNRRLAAIATSLEQEGCNDMSRHELAGQVLRRIEARILDGFTVLPAEALTALAGRDALRDRRVETEEHGPGVARGVEPDGPLVLERPDGTIARVRAGGVSIIASRGG